ncbi:MAG: hypothetical protein ACPGVT_12200 [Maricaulaceae bacterium]
MNIFGPELTQRLRASTYLSDLLSQYGEPTGHSAGAALESLEELKVDDPDISTQLVEAKKRFALGWSALALSETLEFSELGRLQCAFADATLDIALRAAWAQEVAAQRKNVMGGTPDGLFILGLGKLGGLDLNFSSDVDLIAFYDPDVLSVSKNSGQNYIVNKVLRRFTQIITPPRGSDFVWRVDWRLRPEASVSQLGMAIPAAENFYFFRALPWHRLALMKARCVAGDMKIGRDFLDTLTPFIWRQNLDFRALDELAHLKSSINLEHPNLRHERQFDDPITEHAGGFNLKLGRGGIREIEFMANALQLIWGGKMRSLRTSNTLTALNELSTLGHLETECADTLSATYISLRQSENAVQMLGNEQTHIIPEESESQLAILTLLGRSEWQDYCQNIESRRRHVSTEFNRLFAVDSDKIEPPKSALSLESLSSQSREIARSWLEGFSNYGIPRSRLNQFETLGKTLLSRALDAETTGHISHDLVIARIDKFLHALSRSEQYLRLLQSQPAVLNALITPLVYSPHMTVLLEQSPHIIDAFLSPTSYVNQIDTAAHSPDASFVLADKDYETRLERLRRFVNEGLFQYYHCFLQGRDTLARIQSNLTALADTTLETALIIAAEDMGLDRLPITVLGLGKMGTKRMAPLSDIDLIFISDDSCDQAVATKAVRRMRTILTTKLREGIAYELDMRLRPSGRSGPPAVTFSSFKDHHKTRAKTWEHIALCSSRIVAGDPNLGRKIQAHINEVLARPRSSQQLREDALIMWNRLSEQRITATPLTQFNSKLREGGLMQAEYMQSCYKLAGLPDPGFDEAIEFWSRQQIWERLLGLTETALGDAPIHFKSFAPKADLKRAKALQSFVIGATQTYFKGVTASPNSVESSIEWL